MKAKVLKLGAVGMLTDPDAADIPPNAWTDILNARCQDGKLAPVDGYQDITSMSNTGTKDVYAHSLVAIQTPVGFEVVYPYDSDGDGDANKIYAFDGAVADVTRASGGDYTAGPDAEWTVCNYHGYAILNNGVDEPQYYNGVANSGLCADLPYVSGSAWGAFDTDDSGSTNAYTAKVIRAYRDLLVALHITEDTTEYPTMIHWSDVADPSSLPEWDYADTGSLSGRVELAVTPGAVLDAVQLRDSLIVYKEDAIYAASFVGGQFVIATKPITTQYGLWATDCAVDIGGMHVCLGDGVVYTFDGTTPRNILDGVVARQFFDQIDRDYYFRAFLFHNKVRTEVWLCFPERGELWCSKALCWNYKENTWYYRTLPKCSRIILTVLPGGGADDGWDYETSLTWDAETTLRWTSRLYSPIGDTPICGADQLIEFEKGVTADPVYAERTDIVVDDPSTWFLTREVLPIATGDAFEVQIGGQERLGGPVYWDAAVTFTPGVDYKIDSLRNSPIKALRVSSTGADWTLSGYVADMVPTGLR